VANGGVDYGGNTNWQDQIFRTAVSQNYNLGFGGAAILVAIVLQLVMMIKTVSLKI
jgi:uncharacterized membrane protein